MTAISRAYSRKNTSKFDKLRDLVYVHSNLCLLENTQAVNYVETNWEQWAAADSDSE